MKWSMALSTTRLFGIDSPRSHRLSVEYATPRWYAHTSSDQPNRLRMAFNRVIRSRALAGPDPFGIGMCDAHPMASGIDLYMMRVSMCGFSAWDRGRSERGRPSGAQGLGTVTLRVTITT